jgi:hypothetical protein
MLWPDTINYTKTTYFAHIVNTNKKMRYDVLKNQIISILSTITAKVAIPKFESSKIATDCTELGKLEKKPKKKKMHYPYKITEFIKWMNQQEIPYIRIPDTTNFLILVASGDYHYLSIEFRYMTDAYFKTNMKHFKVKRYKCESSAQAVVKTNRYLRLENVN